jgi:hypothetical protein
MDHATIRQAGADPSPASVPMSRPCIDRIAARFTDAGGERLARDIF